ncbi:divergent PAP2 family protein [Candidatus Saccharibacteria bacterium]|nr:divergent PAP2 family protein [Candidatus Saccharibacteria bacterium]
MRKYELLIVPMVAWLVAQGLKFIIFLRKDGLQVSDLYASGGFPSSHTSLITSVTMLLGLRNGLDDPLFAVALVVSALIMYDAVGVRRSSGEQSVAIKELADKTGKSLTTKMHGAKGHTPVEVLGGLGVGILIAFAFYLLV